MIHATHEDEMPRGGEADTAERRLRRDLVAAAGAGAFLLHHQTRQSLRCGRPTATEALPRWMHPKRGLVPQACFAALAEQAGLGVAIGGWALRTACAEAAGNDDDLRVMVRLGAAQLHGPLLAQVAGALEGSGLPPERLELALPEEAVLQLDPDLVLRLSALRDLGVGLALAEFGAGPASLAMLRRLPLTALRLDRALVRALPGDPEDAAIARASIDAGRAMGLTLLADGVETEGQRAFLSACGCDEAAGPLFGPPFPAARQPIAA